MIKTLFEDVQKSLIARNGEIISKIANYLDTACLYQRSNSQANKLYKKIYTREHKIRYFYFLKESSVKHLVNDVNRLSLVEATNEIDEKIIDYWKMELEYQDKRRAAESESPCGACVACLSVLHWNRHKRRHRRY